MSTRALRYYEEQGLLVSERTTGGQRTYADNAVDRIRLIQQLYAAGLSSATIAWLLPCVYAGVTYTAVLIGGAFTLLTITADVINPITIR